MSFVLNPQKVFAGSARQTALPFNKRYPLNTREAFSIVDVNKSGIFQIESSEGLKTYDRCYVFSDINYKNRDEDEKNTILTNLIKLLEFMSADFKITVANEYKNMSQFVNELLSDVNRQQYPDISDGVRDWIKEKIADAKISDTEKVMYLTITTRTYTYDDARTYFMSMDIELQHLFAALKSRIVPLSGVQRLRSLRKFFYKNFDDTDIAMDIPGSDPVLDVIPVSIRTYKNFMIFNNCQYVSVMFARSFDSSLNEEKVVHNLTQVSYPSFLTIDYAPVAGDILKSTLTTANMNNERSITQEIDAKRAKGQLMAGVSFGKDKKKVELEDYMNQIEDNNESCLLVGLMVVVTADTEDELAERVESIKQKGKTAGVMLETYNNVQLKAFNTSLPIGARLVSKMRAFLTSSVVSLQPFYATDLIEPEGYFLGVNRTTKNLIFANRKKLKSPHAMIVGHTGSGKSYFMKETEVAQTLLSTEDDIIIIDPQNEMQGTCAMFGGKFLDFTPKGDIYINPMEISQEIFLQKNTARKDQFVADVSRWANSFCRAVMSNIVYTQEYSSFVTQAVQDVYDKAFAQKRLEWQPTLTSVYNRIAELENEMENNNDKAILHRIYNSLAQYISGGLYDMFSECSNITMDNRFVVFGLKNVSKDYWEPVMITIMFFLSTRMEYNQSLQKATHFIIDETQVVTDNESSADMLLNAVVTYRKFGGIVTLALQNLTRAIQNPNLRDMFSNCGYKVFFDQGGVDAQTLAAVQPLSESEFDSLSEEIPGYGVVVWGKKVILLNASMSKDNELYNTFSTNFHEKKLQEIAKNPQHSISVQILQMAAVVAITAEDVQNTLNMPVDKAENVLSELHLQGHLISYEQSGKTYYKCREE